MYKIAVIITSFNRRDLTVKCLDALLNGATVKHDIDVYLMDDASTDGTAEAVLARFPDVNVIQGSGDLYWNRGMRRAWEAALAANAGFYLWLNDDTVLRSGAVDDMIDLHEALGPKTIICGRIRNSGDATASYGGLLVQKAHVRFGPAPVWTSIRTTPAGEEDLYCDTMNGNCVLIPSSATFDIGLISEHYWHSEGDTDYGYRATNAGYRIAQLKILSQKVTSTLRLMKENAINAQELEVYIFPPEGPEARGIVSFLQTTPQTDVAGSPHLVLPSNAAHSLMPMRAEALLSLAQRRIRTKRPLSSQLIGLT
uniref:Glycosyltransferase family 2 protein n=1 Tax=Phenylobacterium glaciei TaxID=2803784 RepID=A0A974P711_9CAUL|nr:glycosyltransferase family 2 protein [Phenylobacterium glaciei]